MIRTRAPGSRLIVNCPRQFTRTKGSRLIASCPRQFTKPDACYVFGLTGLVEVAPVIAMRAGVGDLLSDSMIGCLLSESLLGPMDEMQDCACCDRSRYAINMYARSTGVMCSEPANDKSEYITRTPHETCGDSVPEHKCLRWPCCLSSLGVPGAVKG